MKNKLMIIYLILTLVLALKKQNTLLANNNTISDIEIEKQEGKKIKEKTFVEINGFKQGMFITGEDSTKPVLLFIHGGPGMPEYAISRKYPQILEKHFTVCWWEQRGAGMSFNSKISKEDLSFEYLIKDIATVSKYLKKRFNQEKIYLMAHSGGTFIGIQAASQYPELFEAYFAIAQISNQLESEKIAFNFMTNEYKKMGNKKMLRKLSKYSLDDLNNPAYYVMRDKPMHELGVGTTREMKSVIKGVFIPVMTNSDYTLRERINIWRGKSFTTKKVGLWDELVNTDLTNTITKIEIPIYFFHGVYDYTVSYKLALKYFEQIEAPLKEFFSFENSAHSPIFEESEKFEKIIIDILSNKSSH